MMVRLEEYHYERVRELFAPLDYQLITKAVIERTTLGAVFVDDADDPRSAFMHSPEGSFLVGHDDNAAFNDALRRLIPQTIWKAERGENELYVGVSPAGWIGRLESLVGRSSIPVPRRHYVCRSLELRWQATVPEGYMVRRIDATLLEEQEIEIPAHIESWMSNNWGSREAFLERGFGCCVTHGATVVSWSLADCASGDRCEIGIHTASEYRRRGLATIATAAAVEQAFAHGFREVGWHCHADNVGSWHTAQKVGFELADEYMMYVIRDA
jgi:RimJ/RimL family protein N-acetyltransferase